MTKRKHSVISHVQESSDEWLSTRNKKKLPQTCQSRGKRHPCASNSRSKSSKWSLTQNSPPPPQLATATTQSSIRCYFGASDGELHTGVSPQSPPRKRRQLWNTDEPDKSLSPPSSRQCSPLQELGRSQLSLGDNPAVQPGKHHQPEIEMNKRVSMKETELLTDVSDDENSPVDFGDDSGLVSRGAGVDIDSQFTLHTQRFPLGELNTYSIYEIDNAFKNEVGKTKIGECHIELIEDQQQFNKVSDKHLKNPDIFRTELGKKYIYKSKIPERFSSVKIESQFTFHMENIDTGIDWVEDVSDSGLTFHSPSRTTASNCEEKKHTSVTCQGITDNMKAFSSDKKHMTHDSILEGYLSGNVYNSNSENGPELMCHEQAGVLKTQIMKTETTDMMGRDREYPDSPLSANINQQVSVNKMTNFIEYGGKDPVDKEYCVDSVDDADYSESPFTLESPVKSVSFLAESSVQSIGEDGTDMGLLTEMSLHRGLDTPPDVDSQFTFH